MVLEGVAAMERKKFAGDKLGWKGLIHFR